jgi:FixJ family two-component response regulator
LTRVFVVANPPEGDTIAGWLQQELGEPARVGDGSDDTLAALEAEPAQVIVLAASLRNGDALAFAHALRDGGAEASLVLIGDEGGPVRTALDAMEFRADRFLRRPLSRSALVFAVRSCLNLGRAGVVGALARRRDPAAPLMSAFAALSEIAPAAGHAEVSAGVVHSLAARLDVATAEAIDAHLLDAVEQALGIAPDVVEGSPLDSERSPEWRDSTMVLSRAAADTGGVAAVAAVQPPDEVRTGTFVSALRQHMSALEVRLFGGDAAAAPAREEEDAGEEIDLDAIGDAVQIVEEPPPRLPDRGDDGRTPPPSAMGSRPGTAPRAPAAAPSSVADEDVPTLLGRLAREGFSGRLVVRGAEGDKTVFLEDGRPVFARADAAGERMGDMLLREGKITREQLARARAVLEASGRRMGEILVEQGALKRRELLPAVRRHVEDVLYSLFVWNEGSAAATPGQASRDEKIRLATPAPALIVEGIRRKLALERLRARVGPPSTVLVPAKREELVETLAEVELSPEERRALELLDGHRSLGEVAAAAGLDELAAWQLAHALQALALARPARDPATEPGRGGTGVSAPGAAITGAADVAIDRERVMAKHAQVCEADYFEILGVRHDATAFEIRRAYEAARRDYAPETFAAEVQRELAAELQDIADVLAEAHQVLRDDAVRTAYLANLIEV